MKTISNYVLFILLFSSFLFSQDSLNKKKVLYINSYHTGLLWSDGIETGIKNTLRNSKIPIHFKRVEMDSKNNQEESYKVEIAESIKKIIENFKPDVVITSDDNAAKYVIVPHFYNSNIPFIFCGINASAKKYGFPSKNVTGMIEVKLIPQLIDILSKYSKGSKIGFLKGDTLSSRIEVDFFEKQLNTTIDKRFVNNLEQWKENFLDLQEKVDILLLGNGFGFKGWNKNKDKIKQFILNNTKIPLGSWDIEMKNLALLSLANIPQEQGVWAAKRALEVLEGRKISSIPITKNKKATIYINSTLGKKLGIVFPFDIIDNAVLVK